MIKDNPRASELACSGENFVFSVKIFSQLAVFAKKDPFCKDLDSAVLLNQCSARVFHNVVPRCFASFRDVVLDGHTVNCIELWPFRELRRAAESFFFVVF